MPYNELKISGSDGNATEEDKIDNAQALMKLKDQPGLVSGCESMNDVPDDIGFAFMDKIGTGEVKPYINGELRENDRGDAYIVGYKYEEEKNPDSSIIRKKYTVCLLIVSESGRISDMLIECKTDDNGSLKASNSNIKKGVTYHLFLAASSSSEHPTASGYTHQHAYEWKVLTDPTIDQDGVYAYMCSCGDIKEKQPVSAAQVFVKELYGKVKEAPQNGTVIYDAKSWSTISDYVLKKMAERNDVAVTIRFNYQKTAYEITFPAGTDYTAVLNDTETMYGFFGIAKLLGLDVKAL